MLYLIFPTLLVSGVENFVHYRILYRVTVNDSFVFKTLFLFLSPFSKGTELVLPTGAYITNLVSLRFVSYINRICTYTTLDNIAF
jgi:hypothetical protein